MKQLTATSRGSRMAWMIRVRGKRRARSPTTRLLPSALFTTRSAPGASLAQCWAYACAALRKARSRIGPKLSGAGSEASHVRSSSRAKCSIPAISPTPAARPCASITWSSRLVPLRGMPAMNTGSSLGDALVGKSRIDARVQCDISASTASA